MFEQYASGVCVCVQQGVDVCASMAERVIDKYIYIYNKEIRISRVEAKKEQDGSHVIKGQ